MTTKTASGITGMVFTHIRDMRNTFFHILFKKILSASKTQPRKAEIFAC